MHTAAELKHLALRALGAEAEGDGRRCTALLQQRLLDSNNAQVGAGCVCALVNAALMVPHV